MHSWGQTHTAVVTAVVLPSHPSHRRRFRRSEQFGSVPSLHTRWTTLGVERHVDLWTKRSSVHSVHRGDKRGPRPRMGTRASGSAALLQGPTSRVGAGGSFLSASAST